MGHAQRKSWATYHPELDGIRGRQAKATMRDTAHDTPASVEIPWVIETPDSISIASAEYDKETQILSVHFKRAKRPERYDYAPVPYELWVEFVQAESKGSFFGARIRPVYHGVKIVRA